MQGCGQLARHRTAIYRLYMRQELAAREGFGDAIIRATLQGFRPLNTVVFGGDHDEGYRGCDGVLTQLAAYARGPRARQRGIQQQEVGFAVLDDMQHPIFIVRRQHLEVLLLEGGTLDARYSGIRGDNQYFQGLMQGSSRVFWKETVAPDGNAWVRQGRRALMRDGSACLL